MIKSKIFDVLKSLSKEELKRFSDYVSSPFYNKRESLITLLQIYTKFHPNFEATHLTKEKVFKKIFPEKKYNDEVFRNLNSDLMKLAEDFLATLNFLIDPFMIKRHLLSEINERNLFPIFEKNFEEAKKILENYNHRDLKYFHNMYILFSEKDLYNSIMLKFFKEDITEAEKNLVKFFTMEIMEIQSYILNECRRLGLDITSLLNTDFIDGIIKKIPKEIVQMPQMQIYYNNLKLKETSNSKYYDNLKNLLNKFGNLIEKRKHYNKYVDMIDYIKRTRSLKDIKTTSELFQLRKGMIENKLYRGNYVSDIFFLNLVKSGLLLKKFDWVYTFINNYRNLIIPKFKESTAELSFALLHFEKNEFEKSLSHLSRVKYEKSSYNLEVKNLSARIYYIMNDFEMLYNLISSYKMYLSKSRVTKEETKKSHSKFVNNLIKLAKIKEQEKFYKLNSLKEQIQNNEFESKNWLLEKIDELNPKKLKNIKVKH